MLLKAEVQRFGATVMAHVNRVLRSIETVDGGRCVDVFVRGNGTYGFEEYRRDAEDARGWFPIGFHSGNVYPISGSCRSCLIAKVALLQWDDPRQAQAIASPEG